MLAVSFTFPAGRYHATPWDRHVNEGAVPWPPEPWRILRALIATWHHKVKYSGTYSEDALQGLLESLAEELPEYRLPAATHSHTRHYMPQFKAGSPPLVFDAFTAVHHEEPLTIVWPGVELADAQRALLDELLSVMNYLGRAESWVEASRPSAAPATNCKPGSITVDPATGEVLGEAVTLYAPLTPADYQAFRNNYLADHKALKKLVRTLPDTFLAALSVDTVDLRKHGWNQPPAARQVSYLRPLDALRPKRVLRKAHRPAATTVAFILVGKPLPRVEDSLRIGELLRTAVMSQAGRTFGENAIPSVLSGHDMPASNRHRHAFYLPWDSNGDGWLDRVLVHVPGGMNDAEQRVVTNVRKLWSRGGSEWRLILESVGGNEAAGVLGQTSSTWESITPYLHPWHVKKRLSVEDQIRRECLERGLPEPIAMEPMAEVGVGSGRKRRPIHFRRFRGRRGLVQPDRLGGFWHVTFAEPVQGPLALGFACHFGLGLFVPSAAPKGRDA